jgi:serine/threonine protein kinase
MNEISNKSDKIEEILGEGEYGKVYSLEDGRACKCFFDKVSRSGIHQTTLREIAGLKLMQRYDEVIKLDSIEYTSDYIKMYMKKYPYDLHSFVDEERLKESQIIDIMHRLILVTYYMEQNKLIHRDIKPGNILLDKYGKAYVCDWGLCRYIKSNKPIQLTCPVQTIGHRAPEIILKKKKYGIEIDMWSLGIILYELLSDKTFCPSNHWRTNINAMFNILGLPSRKELPELYRTKLYKKCKKYKNKKEKLEDIFPNTNENLLDLLKNLLIFDSKKRITPKEALNHKIFKDSNNNLIPFNIWNNLLENNIIKGCKSDVNLFNLILDVYSNKNYETIFLAMRLYNEYEINNKIKDRKNIILSCLHISSKVYDLDVTDIPNIEQVIKHEKHILNYFDYNIFKPTEYNYFEDYIVKNKIKLSNKEHKIATYLLFLIMLNKISYLVDDMMNAVVEMTKKRKLKKSEIFKDLIEAHIDYSNKYTNIYQFLKRKNMGMIVWDIQ